MISFLHEPSLLVKGVMESESMKKRIVSIVMALCLLAGMVSPAWAEGLDLELNLSELAGGALLLPEADIPGELELNIDGTLMLDLEEDGEEPTPTGSGDGEEETVDVDIPADAASDPEDEVTDPELPSGAESPEGLQANLLAADALPDLVDGEGTQLIEPDEETCVIDSPLDSDELAAAYLNRILYGGGALPPVANATDYTREILTDQEKLIYDQMKGEIAEVAEGTRASTIFKVPVSRLLGKTRITARELGVTTSYPITNEEKAQLATAWRNLYDFQLEYICYSLWFDCTYELYWLDRYDQPIRSTKPSVYLDYDDDASDYVVYVRDDANVEFKFPVLTQYRSVDDLYTLDTSLIEGAKRARANAQAIVGQYADCSDYVKLYGYVMEVSLLTDYNYEVVDAAWIEANPQVQDPWKLIWVFDGDSGTNVVCEGFAMAYKYLCELTDFDGDIRCVNVTGYAYGEDHSWNIVRMEDGWNYLVDVTWMDDEWDGASGSLADWISENRGYLFLCGGKGSVWEGYDIYDRFGENTGDRPYRYDTLALYPESTLALSEDRYIPTGFQKIHGDTWYFDENGKYITGKAVLDGYGYQFADSGALLGTLSGWDTVDGTRSFFEADGKLHTSHVPVTDKAVAPTCTEDGKTKGRHCGVCGEVLVAQETVRKLGHRWGRAHYAWADDCKTATANRVCKNDPSHVQSETVKTTAEVVKAPTCTRKGKTTYTARFESAAFATQKKTVADIPATGHTPVVDPAVPATYTTTGLTEGSHCAVCGEVLVPQETVPKLDYHLHMRGNTSKRINVGDPLQIVVDGQKVRSYSSSDPTVASVNCNGWVTAYRAGTATITVTLKNGKKLKLKLTVDDPNAPRSVRIVQGSHATLKVGEKLALTAKLSPGSAKSALAWRSSDAEVVSVTQKGVVKAKSVGKAVVTVVTDNGKRASITIHVKDQ